VIAGVNVTRIDIHLVVLGTVAVYRRVPRANGGEMGHGVREGMVNLGMGEEVRVAPAQSAGVRTMFNT
jgi:hypothetical protein